MNSHSPIDSHSNSAKTEPIEPSVGDVAVRTLTDRLAEVRHQISEFAAQSSIDTETVHRLRVASRRAVAGFDFFEDVIDPSFRRGATKRIKELRSHLGHLRDMAVLIERLDRRSSKGAKYACQALRRKYKRSMPSVQRRVRKIAEKLSRLESRTPSIPLHVSTNQTASTPFMPWARERIHAIARRLFKMLRRVGHSAKSLHRLRIRAKKLRYSLEVLTPAFPTIVMSSAYRRLEKLQTVLGEIQDAVVQQEMLRRLSQDSGRRRIARFVDNEKRRQRRKHAEFLRRLEVFRSSQGRSALAEELARLWKPAEQHPSN